MMTKGVFDECLSGIDWEVSAEGASVRVGYDNQYGWCTDAAEARRLAMALFEAADIVDSNEKEAR